MSSTIARDALETMGPAMVGRETRLKFPNGFPAFVGFRVIWPALPKKVSVHQARALRGTVVNIKFKLTSYLFGRHGALDRYVARCIFELHSRISCGDNKYQRFISKGRQTSFRV